MLRKVARLLGLGKKPVKVAEPVHRFPIRKPSSVRVKKAPRCPECQRRMVMHKHLSRAWHCPRCSWTSMDSA